MGFRDMSCDHEVRGPTLWRALVGREARVTEDEAPRQGAN